MPRSLAGQTYSEGTLVLFAKEFSKYRTADAFLFDFPGINLNIKTLRKAHEICLDYIKSDTNQLPECLEPIKNLSRSTVFEIFKCIDIGARDYKSLPVLIDQLGNFGGQSTSLPNNETKGLIGDYMYCRANTKGGVDIGGIRLFLHYGYSRVAHFFNFEDLLSVRKRENTRVKGRPAVSSSFNPYNVTKLDVSTADGLGVFYASGSHFIALTTEPINARCVLGKPLSRTQLALKHIETTVSGRTTNGSYFAAQSLMFHHSHSRFNCSRNLIPSILQDLLDVSDLKQTVLSY